ncbi:MULTISPECIES: sodium:proton antiporter [Bacillaceae]|uniref:HoxN/HupN/NixA family nickel/cobalt transporter n=1 Tax=Bacillaceae TaxID=186817 RepID=UPI000BECD7C9|nr:MULTISPECIES: sodium:proton antiporter [unclassified Bacillus (in: firmicutes)]PEC48660.1 sodium:proton antiporter [Bacillus sp. AFS096315]PFM82655.1 sodium:proton antiporter [Bacillus sp. AFS077874]
METVSMFFLVFVLGLRHGLDADHLAFIDGQTRFNWKMGSSFARWVGTLFSLGHGGMVALTAGILGMVIENFSFPAYFDNIASWVSIFSLFLIGTLNTYNLLRTRNNHEEFQLSGLKGKFIPKIAKGTTNPFLIILVGALFALAAETVSQTAVWSLAAGSVSEYTPLFLGLVFMFGMMITDTIDSMIVYKMVNQSSKIGQAASRLMGWVIVVLAYGVSFYLAFTFFNPWAELDFEIVGVILFIFLVTSFIFISVYSKKQNDEINTTN